MDKVYWMDGKKGAQNKIQMKQPTKKIHIYHKNCQRNINLWLTEEKVVNVKMNGGFV